MSIPRPVFTTPASYTPTFLWTKYYPTYNTYPNTKKEKLIAISKYFRYYKLGYIARIYLERGSILYKINTNSRVVLYNLEKE